MSLSSLSLSHTLLLIDSALGISLDEEHDQIMSVIDTLACVSTAANCNPSKAGKALFVDTLDDLSLPTLTTYDHHLHVAAPAAMNLPCRPGASYDADCDSDATLCDVQPVPEPEQEVATVDMAVAGEADAIKNGEGMLLKDVDGSTEEDSGDSWDELLEMSMADEAVARLSWREVGGLEEGDTVFVLDRAANEWTQFVFGRVVDSGFILKQRLCGGGRIEEFKSILMRCEHEEEMPTMYKSSEQVCVRGYMYI